MHVQRSKQTSFPATKAMECHWHRNRYIDANHSDLNSFCELTRGITVAGEDGCAITVFVIIDQLNGFFVALHANDRQDRAKNLFVVDAHTWFDVVKQCWTDEIPIFIACDNKISAIDDESGTFRNALIDVTKYFVCMLTRDQWTHMGFVWIHAGTDFHSSDFSFQIID